MNEKNFEDYKNKVKKLLRIPTTCTFFFSDIGTQS